MKRALIVLLLIVALSPWIPILIVDHYLRMARDMLCSQQVTYCSLINVKQDFKNQISFYGYRNNIPFRVFIWRKP
jgi:hypothetical protein